MMHRYTQNNRTTLQHAVAHTGSFSNSPNLRLSFRVASRVCRFSASFFSRSRWARIVGDIRSDAVAADDGLAGTDANPISDGTGTGTGTGTVIALELGEEVIELTETAFAVAVAVAAAPSSSDALAAAAAGPIGWDDVTVPITAAPDDAGSATDEAFDFQSRPAPESPAPARIE
jgi:hypothetical protein